MMVQNALANITDKLKSGTFPDEATVSNGVVLRLLQALDWPVFDPNIVRPEHPAGDGRVDFALCEPADKPAIFVEVKRLGDAGSGEKQLFEYAFHAGIPVVVLTDGQEWHFYLPAERGDYHERRVYLLDLLERDLDEAAERFERYLGYSRVQSGEALQAARTDYRRKETRREITRTLPSAWQELVDEQDDLLVELLAEKVESLCGYKPDPDEVEDFLTNRIKLLPRGGAIRTPGRKKPPISHEDETGTDQEDDSPSAPAFTLHGETYEGDSARDVLIEVFERLCDQQPDFAERMAARPKHGRKRRYIAAEREDLYPDRADLARDYSHELSNGWWVGTNYGTRSIEKRIVPMLAEVADLKLGSELKLHL